MDMIMCMEIKTGKKRRYPNIKSFRMKNLNLNALRM